MRVAQTMLAVAVLIAGMLSGHAAEDRYGDPLPEHAVQRLGSPRLQYYPVHDLGYRPDGRAVIVRSGRVELWNLQTGKKLATYRPADYTTSFNVKDDGHTVVFATGDDRVVEMDLDTGETVRAWDTGQDLRYAMYSPDCTRVLTTGRIPPTIKEWDLDTGEELISIEGSVLEFFAHAIYVGDGSRVVAMRMHFLRLICGRANC